MIRTVTGMTSATWLAEGGRLAMTEGRHSILFYNNNTEYIVFN